MIEKKIIKKSLPIYLFCLLLSIIVVIMTSMYSVPLGLTLGYVINVLALLMTAKYTDLVLLLQAGTVWMTGILFILKFGLYGLGLMLAIKVPDMFHFAAVAVGYFIIKITIYIVAYRDKGGEWSA